MLKVYSLLIIVALLGGVGYAAKSYYNDTQNTIKILRENNAKLEMAAKTAEESTKALQADMKKSAALTKSLQKKLQKAEAYGDELRYKLNKLNLVVEALKDSKVLEGKMNGASAKLWREFMDNTGNTNQPDLPKWLLKPDSGTGSESSNSSPKNNNTNSSETKTSPTN